MSVRRTPEGTFQARFQMDGRRFTGTFDTRKAAVEWETTTRAAKMQGLLPSHLVTVGGYATGWLQLYRAPGSRTSTYKNHEQNVRLYIRPGLGDRALAHVLPSDVQRFLNQVAALRTPARAEHVYRTLSALFNAAEADRLIMRSPVVAKKHRPRRQRAVPNHLEHGPARELLMVMGGWQRDTAMMLMATGARFGEVAGLTSHDLDVGRSKVTFVRQASRGRVASLKNHRARSVQVPPFVLPMVRRLTEQACGAPPIPPLGDLEHDARQWARHWLIQTGTGREASNSSFGRALHVAQDQLGWPASAHVTPHGLRHTYVSWMVAEGHTSDQIAHWIGDTPATVQKVYSHMLEASSAPAASHLESVLGDLG